MSTELVNLQVEADAARAFESASAEERRKLEALVGVLMRQYANAEAKSLKETMNEIGESARQKGLTPEILDSILKD